ncbi:MAG: histidinol-phosphate transaminase [Proteobacteria bacterium]|nr:histidinol-phosphate transaminase [Pseudomonadota bacterium]
MSGPEPKPGILDIAHYVPGKSKVEGIDKPIKLSANENALGSSPAAREAYLAASAELNLYPEGRANLLRERLAEAFSLEPERLIFGCGSDELFTLACQTYLEPGDNIVQPAHGFAAWAIAARACGAEVRNAPETTLTVDVDAMLAAIDARTRIVFIANPANPTGTYLTDAEVRRLHAGLPENVLLLYDGAYAEFAVGLEGYADGLQLARDFPNVLTTRTFSKIYGLAALRVGWGYGAPEVVAAMDRIRLPFNVGRPAQAAAVAALADAGFVERSVAHVRKWLPRMSEAFRGFGLEPAPSATNFVTVGFPKVGATAAETEAFLASRGLIVRGLTNYGLADHLRVTVGTDFETEALLSAMTERFGRV